MKLAFRDLTFQLWSLNSQETIGIALRVCNQELYLVVQILIKLEYSGKGFVEVGLQVDHD